VGAVLHPGGVPDIHIGRIVPQGLKIVVDVKDDPLDGGFILDEHPDLHPSGDGLLVPGGGDLEAGRLAGARAVAHVEANAVTPLSPRLVVNLDLNRVLPIGETGGVPKDDEVTLDFGRGEVPMADRLAIHQQLEPTNPPLLRAGVGDEQRETVATHRLTLLRAEDHDIGQGCLIR